MKYSLRFTLRESLGAITLVAVICGWWMDYTAMSKEIFGLRNELRSDKYWADAIEETKKMVTGE
jgi:hypothetical protein